MPKLNLTITGAVEKIATIAPRSVYLEGKPGDRLGTMVKITPSEKYKFSIIGLEQKVNKNIKATLLAPGKDDDSWQVMVKATSDKPARVFDTLTLKTDSKYMPSIIIRAYAIFIEKQNTGS